MGIAIVGGLIVSQMLTLFTTPVVYLALDSLRPRRANRVLFPSHHPSRRNLARNEGGEIAGASLQSP